MRGKPVERTGWSMQNICCYMKWYHAVKADFPDGQFSALLPYKNQENQRPADLPAVVLQDMLAESKIDWRDGFSLFTAKDGSRFLYHGPSRMMVNLPLEVPPEKWQLYQDQFGRWTVWGGDDTIAPKTAKLLVFTEFHATREKNWKNLVGSCSSN